ncbi:MAG: DUF4398 domain-containing protein [Methylococcales bacterium]|jgi:hypothetical protein|nr:DUF4398 domain-containing protein [Methylococcales bacterium]MBT7445815.1 DUF4398 domain-containing protein [Methylococcales bacterium]
MKIALTCLLCLFSTLSFAKDAKTAILEAKQAQHEANAVNGEWRDVNKTIQQAEAALIKGDTQKANTLAAHAKEQAELGKQQMTGNDSSVTTDFLK